MPPQKSLKRLSKIITYILARKPDEFGLILGPDGFVKLKEFLKAIHEEDGLKFVRKSHIQEILVSQPDPPIEIKGNLIRALHRDKLPRHTPVENLPKFLYTCVRRRTYPVVLEKGIFPTWHASVVLSSSPDLAKRIGKRFDPQPVLLTVQGRKSLARGLAFFTAGETLFLAESIPKDCFAGPLLPQQKNMPAKPKKTEKNKLQQFPGSYFIDLKDIKDRPNVVEPGKKGKAVVRGKDLKRTKKHKLKKEPPPWRR